MSIGIRILLVFAAAAAAIAAAESPAGAFYGKVIKVADGDTLDVLRSGRAVRLRLAGVDCPEKGQAFHARAREFAAEASLGLTVKVVPQKEERWGRLVAAVFLPDGRDLSRELLKAGLAWWYDKYSPGRRDLKELEQQARQSGAGLWRDPRPVPPWDFRRGEK